MDALQIILKNGDAAEADKIRAYFTGLFTAEDTGEDFPVNLDHVWRIGYPRKDHAVRALRKDFAEGLDFQVLPNIGGNYTTGRREEEYRLSVSCLEHFVVRANRDVFEVYRNCRKAVRNVLRGALPDFSNPAAAARAYADAWDSKMLAEAAHAHAEQQLIEAAPKVEFYDAVAVASNALSFGEAAKWLKIPGIDGRNKLIRRLKDDGILMQSREPYQQHIDAGRFEVQPQTYAAGVNGSKGRKLASTTRVTGRGLEWLGKRYRVVTPKIS